MRVWLSCAGFRDHHDDGDNDGRLMTVTSGMMQIKTNRMTRMLLMMISMVMSRMLMEMMSMMLMKKMLILMLPGDDGADNDWYEYSFCQYYKCW